MNKRVSPERTCEGKNFIAYRMNLTTFNNRIRFRSLQQTAVVEAVVIFNQICKHFVKFHNLLWKPIPCMYDSC